MGQRKSRRGYVIPLAAIVLVLALTAMCLSEILLPERGKKTKSKDDLTIDCSHMDQGYVMVKSAKSKKKLKLRVKKGETTLTYDLNTEGDYEVFPLQYGNGKYAFTLYKNVSGKKYAEAGKITLTAEMPDPLTALLYPNQYINYTAESACVKEAMAICAGMTEQSRIFKTVCDYMKTHFVYDYIKSVSVKPGTLPDLEESWEKRMGICQDLSAIMVAMLRSQGVPARMEIGTLNTSTYHAWVVAIVDGKEEFFDPTAALNAVNREDTYTLERYY